MLSLVCFVAVGLKAEIVKKAQVGMRFLENPISAEAIGRGGLGLVMFQNSNSVFWNPAGLGWIDRQVDFNANFTRGIADINHGAFAGAFNLGRGGVIAIDALIMDYGEFNGTRRADNELGYALTDVFTPKGYAVGLSYGDRVSDRFSYGVRLKYAMQDLGDAWITTDENGLDDPTTKHYSASVPAVDIGAIYDFEFHNLRFGAAVQNFSQQITYAKEKVSLPFAVSFGFTIDPLSVFLPTQDVHSLLLGFESQHPRDFKEKIKVGAEYSFRDMFVVRGGYMGNYDERGPTFGFGIKQDLQGLGFRFDYAYQSFGILNSVHILSVGVAR
ncbi:PorV/PorQ family protein [Candidatus Neomarinimicrobiota bacterium]